MNVIRPKRSVNYISYPLRAVQLQHPGAVTKIRIGLSSLLLLVAVSAILIFVYSEYFRIYTDTGIYTDRYVESVVKKRLATLPDLNTLTCAAIDKHLRIDSKRTVLLPTGNVCDEWGQDRIILSPSYVLQQRSCYDDLTDQSTWVSVTIERINDADFRTDRSTLEKYLPRDSIPPKDELYDPQ